MLLAAGEAVEDALFDATLFVDEVDAEFVGADAEFAALGFCGAAGAVVDGFGAETPAMPEPKPSFCRLVASSFPLGSRPCSDWNFCIAPTVLASHLPLGSPW